MFLLVSRRSAEKTLTDKIPSTALAWLQQATAIPFLILMLPFAVWYNPFTLSSKFQILILVYAIVVALDLILYYKSISIGDISIVAPLLNLTAVSGIISSYVLLGQKPSIGGIIASTLIVLGAYLVAKHKNKHSKTATNNRLAILIIVFLILLRGIYSPIEVTLLRETNPIYLNFLSSMLTVPVIVSLTLLRQKQSSNKHFTNKLKVSIFKHKFLLGFIGLTMALNIYFSLTAKTLAPNAGYVTAIKGVQVIPMVFIGVIFFKEQVTKLQWLGVFVMLIGLICFLFS